VEVCNACIFSIYAACVCSLAFWAYTATVYFVVRRSQSIPSVYSTVRAPPEVGKSMLIVALGSELRSATSGNTDEQVDDSTARGINSILAAV